MKYFAGLDVSLKDISVCVVDEAGRVVLRGSVQSEPAAVADFLATRRIAPERIVHESGQLSIWLQRGLVRLGLPAVCIDARIAQKALSARLNKSDATDAEGLAHLARTGWYTPVHVRSENADRVRTLIAARERLIRLRKDLEGHVRGALKTFGIRMTAIGQGKRRQASRDQLAAAGEVDPVLAAIADGFIAAHETLCIAAEALEEDLRAIARESRLARRLMTIPGVGPIVSLSFIALVDDADRFRKVADVGAFLGTDTAALSIRCDRLFGPCLQMWRCRDARSPVRGCQFADPPGSTLLAAQIVGGAAGRATRLQEGGDRHRTQDRRSDADALEERQ